ncbi:hypothetical protein QVD17_26043 [Tagetes erecta]|uniref:Exocyst subunit Exo70 family protein n=1 Tax=Tagetes erecta TaxID=13708 RepID=A0AAD8K6R3_TARER|nr:hypothetical protein QVD17_26043 [Tagetes erecta]
MTIDSSIGIIYRWRSTSDHNLFIFHDRRDEIVPYLQAVDEIQRTVSSANSEDERKQAKSVMQIAVSRLADEFRNVLKVHGKVNSSLNPNSYTDSTTMTDSASSNFEIYEDDYVNRNRLSTEAINDLRTIAVKMNSYGFVDECLKVYVSKRKSVIGDCLKHLNVEKLSSNSCRRLGWGVLELKMKIWIKAVKVCFRYYFVNEKQLCELIFNGLGDETSDTCFVDTITDHTVQLFDIVEALSCIRPGSERLFKILDLYDTLSDLISSIDDLFNSQSSDLLRTRAVNQIIPKLADKANEILSMFERSLVNEQSPVVCSDPIHRLSKYVMHYVYKFCDHKQTLTRLSLPNLPSMDGAEIDSSSFSLHVNWIIMSLVSNLEVKSNSCKDLPASKFFAMNNFHYIIQKIKARTELVEFVAEDNFNKLVKKFEDARSDYLNLTFGGVLRNLRDEGLNKIKILSFKVSKLRYRLKRFNDEFEGLQKDLGKLVVPDFELVLELRKLVVEMVVTAYTSFLLHTKKLSLLKADVKYSVEEIESAIQRFFDCNSDR